jgi:hypothetical protein
MSAKEMAALVGRQAEMRIELSSGTIYIPVTIEDAKAAYGRVVALVSPVGGEGTAWVDRDRLTLVEVAP